MNDFHEMNGSASVVFVDVVVFAVVVVSAVVVAASVAAVVFCAAELVLSMRAPREARFDASSF